MRLLALISLIIVSAWPSTPYRGAEKLMAQGYPRTRKKCPASPHPG